MSNLTKSIPADERKMLRKAFWRSFTLYAAVSPAKQGASGFCYSLMPFINKFYKNDEEGKKAALTEVCLTSIQPSPYLHSSWVLWHPWRRKTASRRILMQAPSMR